MHHRAARGKEPGAPAAERGWYLASLALILAAPAAAQTATASIALPADVRLTLGGFIHADAVVWDESSIDELDPSTRAPLNDTRLLIRRARLRAAIDRGIFSGGLEIDGNTVAEPELRLLAADVTVRPLSEIGLTVGLLKIPFGAATPEKVRDRLFFGSPSFVRAYFPGEYDLGAVIHGEWDVVRYLVAAMNGDPGGRDLTAGKDLLGRLGVDVPIGPVRIVAGFSALFGEGIHAGTPTTKDELVWRDVNENGVVELTELQVIAGAAATPSETFDRFALGGDLRIVIELPWLGQMSAFAELIWAGNLDRGLEIADPVATGRDLRELGWSIGLETFVGPWGRVGARYDRYDPDADASDARGGRRVPFDASVSTLSVVAEWRPVDFGTLAVEYDHNTNSRGRGLDGAPARFPDDTFVVRAAVGF